MKRANGDRVVRDVEVWFYGRFSTDLQRDSSIEQQHEVAVRICRENGLPPPAKHRRYEDRAISGKSMKGRDELVRLLRDASTPSDGVQRVLVLEDLDRFSRNFFDSIEMAKRLVVQLKFRILTEGLDSEDDDHFIPDRAGESIRFPATHPVCPWR